MYTVKVSATTQYDVTIGNGVLQTVGEIVSPLLQSDTVAVVTDDNVKDLYLETVVQSLQKQAVNVKCFVFKSGEKNKNLDTYGQILRFLAKERISRRDTLIALGGGVTGDLTGFAASTYMRGINYIGLPTTLLAGVDSSVGGKTAVDLPEGKNLVGTFYQPRAVIFDVDTLKTLPEKEIKNGMGELVKCGVLTGGELWNILEGGRDCLQENLVKAVALAVKYKRDIVNIDEKETGERRLLNLGHTMAHGIEKLSEYTIPHGEAVAVGLRMIADASRRNGDLGDAALARIYRVLENFGLNTRCTYSVAQLAEAARVDKKVEGESINVVKIKDVGNCIVEKMSLDELENFFYECKN